MSQVEKTTEELIKKGFELKGVVFAEGEFVVGLQKGRMRVIMGVVPAKKEEEEPNIRLSSLYSK